MNPFFRFFLPAPHLPEMTDAEQIKSQYSYWRQRTFYSMLLGYAFYYFTRKSFTAAMPGLMIDLHLDKSQLGILGSVFSIAYGMSKFFSGILADQSNPRYFMAFGLFLTGVCNICFGLSSSLTLFVLFWAANGFFQGFGWPACARSLTNWYSVSERGAWWSSTSVAHNLGSFITPIFVGCCLKYFGWRFGMCLPGLLCFAGAAFLINRLRDTPQSLGLPPIEKFRNDYPAKATAQEEHGLSTGQLLKEVLSNPYIWLLSGAYFFVYILRMGIGEWTALFLYEEKGYTILSASATSACFEAGGFFGCLVAGWASDRLFRARRGLTSLIFTLGILLSLTLFRFIPPGHSMLDLTSVFLMGFAVFGPQLLIGMFAAEICHKRAAATANGFVGWIAYIGAAVSGYPMGVIIDRFGWNGAFTALSFCTLFCFAALLPLWRVTRATFLSTQSSQSPA